MPEQRRSKSSDPYLHDAEQIARFGKITTPLLCAFGGIPQLLVAGLEKIQANDPVPALHTAEGLGALGVVGYLTFQASESAIRHYRSRDSDPEA
ncbi:MAG TPA: hypothetical protein VFL85_04425 [Candidatus Saccharimonadales bacterium]|nr:hypothetical protein [Candidatus Saccharimonadales bacterium]